MTSCNGVYIRTNSYARSQQRYVQSFANISGKRLAVSKGFIVEEVENLSSERKVCSNKTKFGHFRAEPSKNKLIRASFLVRNKELDQYSQYRVLPRFVAPSWKRTASLPEDLLCKWAVLGFVVPDAVIVHAIICTAHAHTHTRTHTQTFIKDDCGISTASFTSEAKLLNQIHPGAHRAVSVRNMRTFRAKEANLLHHSSH